MYRAILFVPVALFGSSLRILPNEFNIAAWFRSSHTFSYLAYIWQRLPPICNAIFVRIDIWARKFEIIPNKSIGITDWLANSN